MSYRETYRVEGGITVLKGGFPTKQAAIDWAHAAGLTRYLIWAMGAKMYVHQEVGQ